jgi:hypothetical protein
MGCGPWRSMTLETLHAVLYRLTTPADTQALHILDDTLLPTTTVYKLPMPVRQETTCASRQPQEVSLAEQQLALSTAQLESMGRAEHCTAHATRV